MTLPTTCPDCKQPLSIMEDYDGSRLLVCVLCAATTTDEALAPTPANLNRLAVIQQRLDAGDLAATIAQDMHLSRQRLAQIIHAHGLHQTHGRTK